MDFRDWKKVCEDNKTCTLQHPKGHKLTVMLKGLPSLQREQIKLLKMANGGQVKKFADGTPDGTVDDNQNSSDSSQNPSGSHTSIVINAAPAAPAAAAPQAAPMPSMAQAVNPAAQFAKEPVQIAAPTPVQTQPNLNPNGQANPSAISKNSQLIPGAQKDIDIAQSKAEGQNLQQLNEGLGSAMEGYQDRYNNLAKHVDDFAGYMQKNPIDPKHYQENMGSGAKTAAAIGLFFGGLGTPFGGHNFAADFLNKQIDRDIEGQKARADQQKTIYGAYKDLFGEGKEALAATKATMIDIFNNKQKMVAAQLGTPQAAVKSAALENQLAIDKQKALREGATQLNALPGFNSNSNAPQKGNLKLINGGKGQAAPQQGAAPKQNAGAGDWQGSSGQAAQKPKTYSILSPDAQGRFNNIMKGYDPQWSGKSDQINKEFTAAQQAEKVLNGPDLDGRGGIHDIMNEMYDATKKMGVYGHLHQKAGDALGDIPIIGEGGRAASEIIPQTHSEKRFNSLRTNLEADLGTALAGIMTPTDIHKAVMHSAPAYQDTPDDIAFKEQQFVNTVMKSVRSPSLNGANMLYKKK